MNTVVSAVSRICSIISQKSYFYSFKVGKYNVIATSNEKFARDQVVCCSYYVIGNQKKECLNNPLEKHLLRYLARLTEHVILERVSPGFHLALGRKEGEFIVQEFYGDEMDRVGHLDSAIFVLIFDEESKDTFERLSKKEIPDLRLNHSLFSREERSRFETKETRKSNTLEKLRRLSPIKEESDEEEETSIPKIPLKTSPMTNIKENPFGSLSPKKVDKEEILSEEIHSFE